MTVAQNYEKNSRERCRYFVKIVKNLKFFILINTIDTQNTVNPSQTQLMVDE